MKFGGNWGDLGGIWGNFIYDWGLLTGIRQGIYFGGGIVSWKEHYYHYCKQPKQHKPPKCISVVCKEEKESLEEQLMDIQKELDDTRKELEKAQEELSECNL